MVNDADGNMMELPLALDQPKSTIDPEPIEQHSNVDHSLGPLPYLLPDHRWLLVWMLVIGGQFHVRNQP